MLGVELELSFTLKFLCYFSAIKSPEFPPTFFFSFSKQQIAQKALQTKELVTLFRNCWKNFLATQQTIITNTKIWQ